MADTCSSCGKKFGILARLGGITLCDDCAAQDAERARVLAQVRAEARAEYEQGIASIAAGDSSKTLAASLRRLRARAGLSESDRVAIALEAYRGLLVRALGDGRMTEAKDERLEAAKANLRLDDKSILPVVKEFGSRYLIAQAKAGNLPVIERPGLLTRGNEAVHWAVPAHLMKEVVDRQTLGGYAGMSFRVAKGVRLNTGAIQAQSRVVGSHMEVADQGLLSITSQRVVFTGTRSTVELAYSKFVSVNASGDGVQFHVTNRRAAPLFRVDDGPMVAALVGAAYQRNGAEDPHTGRPRARTREASVTTDLPAPHDAVATRVHETLAMALDAEIQVGTIVYRQRRPPGRIVALAYLASRPWRLSFPRGSLDLAGGNLDRMRMAARRAGIRYRGSQIYLPPRDDRDRVDNLIRALKEEVDAINAKSDPIRVDPSGSH